MSNVQSIREPGKRVAIVGTGIAGNVAAYLLRREHDITVYEAEDYVGGHTNTVDVPAGDRGGTVPIDTGFIVFNDRTYPNFMRILEELGQSWKPSVMSFSVQSESRRIEYNGASLNALFAQRRNILNPPFYRMVRDILRFNREAPAALNGESLQTSVGEYLQNNRYSSEFADLYLVPMAAAIWSAEPGRIGEMPLHFLVRFFRNHGLLQLKDRPAWRVIDGGSREYVRKMVAGHRERIRLSTAVTSISRDDGGVTVTADGTGPEKYDAVFLACHSDQSLRMLTDATAAEREVLGAIAYQANEAVLHTDVSLLPRRKRCWAAWNYHIPDDSSRHVAATYNMNLLQGLRTREQYCVTLNCSRRIAAEKVVHRVSYEHPVFSRQGVQAQRRHAELNRANNTYYCGSYWRNGFHEDGVVSAITAVRHFEENLQHEKLHIRRAS